MFHALTYDMHGNWEDQTGHHSPLYVRNSELSTNAKFFNVVSKIK